MSLIDTTSTVAKDPATVNKFTEFLEQHYADDISRFPDTRDSSFYIKWEKLQEYNSKLSEKTENNPEQLLYQLEVAIRDFDDSIKGLDKATVRITDHTREIPIREIRAAEMNQLVSVEGIVSKATEVKPKIRMAVFECIECGQTCDVVQMDEELNKPHRCPNDECRKGQKNLEVVESKSKMIDYQKVQVQEPPENIDGGDNPQSIDVTILGGATGDVTPGDRVTATGILRGKLLNAGNRGKKSIMRTFLQGLTIYQEEQDFEELEITDKDEKEIEALSEDPDVYDKLSATIAPSIFGFDIEKQAMALQLFSGVPKKVDDGNSRIRGDLHMLFVGDPGTGKSQLIRYVKQLAPRGVFTSGKGTSSAGLTAAAVRDSEFGGDDKWTLQAGALVLADKGIACVDELDKMKPDDRSALHEALEQQTISVNKAGINATLKSRCSLLAAANPEEGRFDDYYTVPEQINLEPPLISRFDLIFIVTDEADNEKDSAIARHIMKTNRAGERNAKGLDINGAFNEDSEASEEKVTGEIDTELFQKYVAYARKHCFPELTQEAEDYIVDFYVNIRRQGEEEGVIAITARKLESLIRLAEASARVRLSEDVELQDAQRAVRLTRVSMGQTGTDPDSGNLDADSLETGQSTSQRERKHSLMDLMQLMMDAVDESDYTNNRPCIDKDEFMKRAEENGHERGKVDREIEKMKKQGDLIEPRNNMLSLI